MRGPRNRLVFADGLPILVDSGIIAIVTSKDAMQTIAHIEKDADSAALEPRLWGATDQLCANSGSESRKYSAAVHVAEKTYASCHFCRMNRSLST